MRIPVIRGCIDRRILANYRIDPDVMADNLPAPFHPKLHNGYAIGGICLIRLTGVRPRFLPLPWGIRSENAAHRIAVEWEDNGQWREGVYIPRRDSSSRLNAWAGGTIFPGVHHLAKFEVKEDDSHFSVAMQSQDGDAHVLVEGDITDSLPETSVFSSIEEASLFFERGSLGYSDTHSSGRYDGLELRCQSWKVEALKITQVRSSYFENQQDFPKGSVHFDCALLMRDIQHEWHGHPDLCCPAP